MRCRFVNNGADGADGAESTHGNILITLLPNRLAQHTHLPIVDFTQGPVSTLPHHTSYLLALSRRGFCLVTSLGTHRGDLLALVVYITPLLPIAFSSQINPFVLLRCHILSPPIPFLIAQILTKITDLIMGVQSIPTEILIQIFSSLTSPDLLRTSRVSRRIRAISLPLLYSSLSLATTEDIGVNPAPVSTLEKFLRTVLAPGGEALAAHVNTLNLYWAHRGTNNEEPQSPQPLNQMALAPHNLTPNAQVVLLLSRLPNLRVFDVTPNFTGTWSFNNFALEFIVTEPSFQSAFHSLREVRFTPRRTEFGVDEQTLLVLLQLPSIDCIDIYLHITSDIEPDYGEGLSSSVTKLNLWNDGIEADELATILMIPRALTHLSCTSPMSGVFKGAMRPVRRTLQYLHLAPLYNARVPPELGSLRRWGKLRSVQCILDHLLGKAIPGFRHLVDVLPSGIRELGIMDREDEDYPRVVEEVVALLQRKAELVPGLKRLTVDMPAGEQQEILLRACAAAGVSFSSQGVFGDGFVADA